MKSAVIAAAVLVCAATASAQDVTGGIKGGFNNTKFWFDEGDRSEVDARTRAGLVVGLFTSIELAPRFAFQPEFLYSQKGSTLRFAFDPDQELEVKLDYFEIPLLADIRLNEGVNRVSLMVGPTISFRTKAETDPDLGFDGEDVGDALEKNDFGLTAGAALTMGQFVIDGRYTWGLKNINVDKDEEKITNRTLSVTVGWRFR